MRRVVGLGWTPVRGTRWLEPGALDLDAVGVVGDRAYSPVTPDLACVKAMRHPELLAWSAAPDRLPTSGGRPATLAYWGREFPGEVWDDATASELSALYGAPLLLARTAARPGFIWDCPVSLLTTTELGDLPGPPARYRANVVLDDADDPVPLRPGTRVEVGESVLELVRPIERCVLIDRDPATGQPIPPVLGRLGPAVTLAWGCRVVRPGRVRRDAPAEPDRS